MRDELLKDIFNGARRNSSCSPKTTEQGAFGDSKVALLTGGADKDYAVCLALALASQGVALEFIGSDDVNATELHSDSKIKFLNLRGDQSRGASLVAKCLRVLRYYAKLIAYAATAKPQVFHILWNNKFQFFDRTLLMLYYRLLGRKITFTAHNVNAGKRDANDSFSNRLSLRVQYRLADQIFVHTKRMKSELMAEFVVPEEKITVIPYGLYNNLPDTGLTSTQAKRAFGLSQGEKALLFFGNIVPYKGLECLLAAVGELTKSDASYRLIIAGSIKNRDPYWAELQRAILRGNIRDSVIQRIGFVPSEEVELYFKAADVLILPYTQIFQSGVLFLGYSFGLPVVATDVGSLKEDIVPGETGFLCPARDAAALARTIEEYFSSELYKNLDQRREAIKAYAQEGHSWAKVGQMTKSVYSALLGR